MIASSFYGCGLRFEDRDELRKLLVRWRVVEVDASQSGEPRLEPPIEGVLGLSELPERPREVGTFYVGDKLITGGQ
jgi:hypothetical protein